MRNFQNRRRLVLLELAAFLITACLAAETPRIPSEAERTGERPRAAQFEEFLRQGFFWLDLRLRYEMADQSDLDASHAATARSRIGYNTLPSLPVSAAIELENIAALDGGAYNQAGLNGKPEKTVIPDPETTEVNQAFLRFGHEHLSARAGRQRILLDQQRFIGNVGWRQNEQTFDAILVQAHDGENSRFTYGYIDRVARVFGKDHPAGRFDSRSHIANASTELPLGGAGGYAYLLRFDNAPASSGDTFGLWFRPSVSSATTRLSASIESAWQVDNSASTPGADFGHYYFRTDVGATFDPISAGAGFERLAGDGQDAFQTPLATLHAFNGWADQFLTTPANGLDDMFLTIAGPLAFGAQGRVEAHYFTATRGSQTYGREIGFLITRSIHERASLLAKAAIFDGKAGRPDVLKLWIHLDFRIH